MNTRRRNIVKRKTKGLGLDGKSRRILSSIFRLSNPPSAGVDVQDYRANHADQWKLLEALEGQQYLIRDSNQMRYVVGVTGLPEVSDRGAKRLLSNAERAFAELRKRYRENSKGKVLMTDLAASTDIALDELREVVRYLVQASVVGGRSADLSEADAYVMPTEKTVSTKFRRFRDVVTDIRHMLDSHRDARFPSFTAEDFSVLPRVAKPQRNARAKRVAWYRELKRGIRDMMEEVNIAMETGVRGLAAMGLRTVLDMSCNDVLGDMGGFAQKLNALHKDELITAAQKRMLENALEVGHAAAHRGHVPSKNEIAILRDIVEHLLKQMYVLGPASERLRKGVPPRNALPNKRGK